MNINSLGAFFVLLGISIYPNWCIYQKTAHLGWQPKQLAWALSLWLSRLLDYVRLPPLILFAEMGQQHVCRVKNNNIVYWGIWRHWMEIWNPMSFQLHIDGLVQERCISSALGMKLCYVFLALTHWYIINEFWNDVIPLLCKNKELW